MKRQRSFDLPASKRIRVATSNKRKGEVLESTPKRQTIKTWSTEEIFAKNKKIRELETQLQNLIQICMELKKENERLGYIMSINTTQQNDIGLPYQTAY